MSNNSATEQAVKVNCTTTLFFARLGTTKEEELKQYCERYGKIKDLTLIIDKETNKTKGCGFVKFLRFAWENRRKPRTFCKKVRIQFWFHQNCICHF